MISAIVKNNLERTQPGSREGRTKDASDQVGSNRFDDQGVQLTLGDDFISIER